LRRLAVFPPTPKYPSSSNVTTFPPDDISNAWLLTSLPSLIGLPHSSVDSLLTGSLPHSPLLFLIRITFDLKFAAHISIPFSSSFSLGPSFCGESRKSGLPGGTMPSITGFPDLPLALSFSRLPHLPPASLVCSTSCLVTEIPFPPQNFHPQAVRRHLFTVFPLPFLSLFSSPHAG